MSGMPSPTAISKKFWPSVGCILTTLVLQVKYLNNIVEQDHRFIKKLTRPMQGFKSFAAAQATLAGIETAHMIRKGQLAGNGGTAFQQFAALAG